MPDIDPVAYAIPVFVLLIVGEAIWAWRRAPHAYEARDTAASLMMGLGSTVAGALTGTAVFAMLVAVHKLALLEIGWAWWAWIACFVLDDLAYYWFHRMAHRVRWFWAAHVNHHSSQHYNLSTALRQSWTGFFALSFIFRLPLALVGFEPAMILACGGLTLIYQFWIHTEAIGQLPRWFEAVMNSPSHHRVHHAVNPRYLDRNFAGTFIVWDKLFGTYEPERDGETIRYGIVHQLGSFNILRVAFHEWSAIVRDVRDAPWGSKSGYLWREPGWSHDSSRETSADIRTRWELNRNDRDAVSDEGHPDL